MLKAENTYRLYTPNENVPYWNHEGIAADMPFLFSVGRNKTNGGKTIKPRNFPGYLKQRGTAIYAEAYKAQDKVRMDYRRIEEAGELASLILEAPFGKIELSGELSEYFLTTSQIAELYVRGWRFTAK